MAGGERSRGPLGLAAAGVVLVLVVGVVTWVERKGPEPAPATELVATTAERWLRAWQRGDIARMERLTTRAEPVFRMALDGKQRAKENRAINGKRILS